MLDKYKHLEKEATWILRHQQRALSTFKILNSKEDNETLEAINQILRKRRKR